MISKWATLAGEWVILSIIGSAMLLAFTRIALPDNVIVGAVAASFFSGFLLFFFIDELIEHRLEKSEATTAGDIGGSPSGQ